MKFITAKTYDELSRYAANLIGAQVTVKPDCVLGLATGSSPVGTYRELIRRYENGDLDFSKVTSVNLDEYVGLTGEHEQSYRYFMNDNLFNHVNIRKECTFVPDGCAANPEEECRRYDENIARLGGIDLQLLGIGLDGHIGFNEPDDAFPAGTHVAVLDESTVDANARFFSTKDEVPRKALTMGIAPIMQAKKVLLIANGKKKKDILMKALYGPIVPTVPASILQLHPDLTVIYSEE